MVISDFKKMPELEEFRSHLHSLYRPNIKDTYGIHDPEGLKWLFQLRVGLSPLRYHKKRHNFLDTPDDNCLCKTDKETVEHDMIEYDSDNNYPPTEIPKICIGGK